jgi:hypothetical protein
MSVPVEVRSSCWDSGVEESAESEQVQVEEFPSYNSREQILERKEVVFQATQSDLTSHGKLSLRTDDTNSSRAAQRIVESAGAANPWDP